MFEKYYNKHYIRVDNGIVVKGFSDAFGTPLETDICINDHGGRHFEIDGEINPPLYAENGCHVYRYDDTGLRKATEEELAEELHIPTAEELLASAKASKKEAVSRDCEKIIYAGINVTLSDGNVEHFALTEHDQINLFGKQAQLAAGVDQLEYHAGGQLCRYYSAADMQAIIDAAMFHVSYHTTYCNSLNMWIAGCQTEDELQQIFYGADVPEEYQSEVLKAYLLQIARLAEENVDDAPTPE